MNPVPAGAVRSLNSVAVGSFRVLLQEVLARTDLSLVRLVRRKIILSKLTLDASVKVSTLVMLRIPPIQLEII